MSELDAALDHAVVGRPVFPASRRVPVVKDWGNAATTDPAIITAWWTERPFALIGMPTGKRTGLAVLDIDMKNGKNGCRTLAKLGYVELPRTPTVLTPSGGFHLHFQRPEGGFRNTTGERGRGIGDGLDWRCDGGLVFLPSPESGYRWAEHNYDNCSPLPVPADLMPRAVERNPFTAKTNKLVWFDPRASLEAIVRTVAAAHPGERNSLAFWGACRAGEMVAAGTIKNAEKAIAIIAKAAQRAGLPEREAIRTARSGVETGGATQ